MTLQEKVKASIRDVADFPRPGILFKDITPLLAQPALVEQIINSLTKDFEPLKADAIVGIESRGFIFGSLLANALHIPFVPVRKAGKLPFRTIHESYQLEYGSATVEMHNDALQQGSRVIIHDDLLATGGTAAAAGRLVNRLGARVETFSFLINLSFLGGESTLTTEFGVNPHCLLHY
jgi:adenine phosphoribosyltransferase